MNGFYLAKHVADIVAAGINNVQVIEGGESLGNGAKEKCKSQHNKSGLLVKFGLVKELLATVAGVETEVKAAIFERDSFAALVVLL